MKNCCQILSTGRKGCLGHRISRSEFVDKFGPSLTLTFYNYELNHSWYRFIVSQICNQQMAILCNNFINNMNVI